MVQEKLFAQPAIISLSSTVKCLLGSGVAVRVMAAEPVSALLCYNNDSVTMIVSRQTSASTQSHPVESNVIDAVTETNLNRSPTHVVVDC